MLLGLIIFCLSIIAMITIIIAFPNVKFWIVPLVGALLLIICQVLDFDYIITELFNKNSINPIQILILFISMTFISIVLDEVGLFRFLASYALKKAKSKQIMLFIYLYITTSILTVFTSNDIIILTFTPFIIFFCKNAKINPIPYLVTEFVSANTWSMMFIIGNPTNIFLGSSMQIDFISYFKVMFLPCLVMSLTSFLMLLLLFRKSFKQELDKTVVEEVQIKDKAILVISLVILIICIIMLMLEHITNIPMYLVSFASALSLLLFLIVYNCFNKKISIVKCLKQAPWSLVPFVLSMFVLTLFLKKYEITNYIFNTIGENGIIYKYGILSFITCNLINNIPMSVLFSNIISLCSEATLNQAVYSTIISSNLGAILTPIGALAGIMWLSILKKNDVKFNFFDFVKYGIVISIPTLLVGLFVLSIIL